MKNYSRFKLIVLLLSITIVGITSSNISAAIRDINIGSNSSGSRYWPSYTQPNSVSTALYSAEEMNQSSQIGNSFLISKLGFYVRSTNNPDANSFDNVYILLKNTDANTAELPVEPCGMTGINALVSNGFQIVKGPFALRGSQLTTGWNDFEFTTPFQYNNGANLHLVVISVNQQNTADGTVNDFLIGVYPNTATALTKATAFYSPANYCQVVNIPDSPANTELKPFLKLEIEDDYSGQTYLTSSTTQSIVTMASEGETNVNVLKVEIKIHGSNPTLNNLTQMIFDGKTSLPFVSNAKLYYTGTNPVFNTSNQIADVRIDAANINNITFDGNVALSHGTNYFWFTYDINGEVANNGNVDAALTNFTLSGTGLITNTTTKDPAGSIYIKKRNDELLDVDDVNGNIGGELYTGVPYNDAYQYFMYLYPSTSYLHACSESLLFPNDMDSTPKTLYNLAVQLSDSWNSSWNMTGVSIFLKNSDTAYLEAGMPDTVNGGYIKVLENATIPLTPMTYRDWIVFAFDTPFEYTGGNLQVLVVRHSTNIVPTTLYTFSTYTYTYSGVDAGDYVAKYGRGTSSLSTFNQSNYRPSYAFNKYEGNQLCTNSGTIAYEGDVTTTYIRSADAQPPYTSSYGKTTSNTTYNGYWNYQPKSLSNWLYLPGSMGNTALGNCPRTITGMDFYQYARYTSYYNSEPTESWPFEIWLRNTSNTLHSSTDNNPNTYYANLETNGFIKVFEGTFDILNKFRKYHVDFNLNNFEYDGTSSVEVVLYSHHPTNGTTLNTGNYLYLYYYGQTNTTGHYCRTSYTTSANIPTTWSSSGNYYIPMVNWYYTPQTMIINNIENIVTPEQKVTDKEFILFGTAINTEGSCAPYPVTNIKLRLNNSDNVKIDKLKVYTNDYATFQNPTLITTLHNPEGNLINISLENQFLKEGTTCYWITAEINGVKTECLSTVAGSLMSINIGGREWDNRHYMETPYAPVTIEYTPINFPSRIDDKICFTKTDSVYTVDVEGFVGLYQWYLWDQDISNYKPVEGATSNSLNIFKDNIINGINRARVVAFPPAAGNCSETDTLDLNFSISYPVRDVYTTINGEVTSPTDTIVTCYETETVFIGNYEGDATSFQWEYLDAYNVWQPISLADVLTANQDTMYFIAGPKFRNASIRFVAYSDASCNTFEASTPFSVKAFALNQFTIQPPQKVNLCKGDRLYVTAIFSGETPESTQWYKDGFPLQYNLEQTLDISQVEVSDAGVYWYEVAAGGCNGDEILRSNSFQLFINPDPAIISQPTTVKAQLDDVALLKIDANYSTDGSSEDLFKWFRHDGILNIDISLNESNRMLGTKSNILTIIPISDDDYTYNGDYYFCRIYALCSDSNDYITSEPIYLLPGNELLITRQPATALICTNNLPTDVTLDIYAFSSDDNTKIFYQWYEDNVELLNNTEFSGVNTQHLTIHNVNTSGIYGDFYCRVWYDGADPYVDFIMSDTANILLSYPVAAITEIDTIYVNINDSVELDGFKNLAAAGSGNQIIMTNIEWFYLDANGNYHPLPGSYIPVYTIQNISIYQAGTYVARITTPCNVVEKKFVILVDPNLKPEFNPVIEETNIELQMSPNPVSDIANFTFTHSAGKTYYAEVTDLSGAAVYSITGTTEVSNNIKLDIKQLNLTSGSYIFNLLIDNKKTTKSFIVTK